MKFGRAHDLPSASKAELSLEPVIKESPTEEYEVLPRKLPRKSGTKFYASEGGTKFSRRMKFGASEAKLPLEAHHRNEVRRKRGGASAEKWNKVLRKRGRNEVLSQNEVRRKNVVTIITIVLNLIAILALLAASRPQRLHRALYLLNPENSTLSSILPPTNTILRDVGARIHDIIDRSIPAHKQITKLKLERDIEMAIRVDQTILNSQYGSLN
ncbi:hypothetical protein COCNU_02G012470 [Cocos nucifera]|uniref:Transmembrane protein n=1 Tax=Cocos nucifera TaxID=13894 RepID=A0A8K0MXM0_COCNU|nr:hypothetical protein COCNU_02G012470 [Cocos nucifera]